MISKNYYFAIRDTTEYSSPGIIGSKAQREIMFCSAFNYDFNVVSPGLISICHTSAPIDRRDPRWHEGVI
jgi:hypothetical protein